MHYRLQIHTAMGGDTIPLIAVAESMARHAASGFGTQPLHSPTLVESRKSYIALLLDAASRGLLTVCDSNGRICPAENVALTQRDAALNSRAIVTLFVRAKHLTDWGSTNGDEFQIEDIASKEILVDLKNGEGEVVRKDYLRGFIGYAWDAVVPPVAHTAASMLVDASDQPRGLMSTAPKLGTTSAANSVIPGKLPRVAIGQLAVQAAYEFEIKLKRKATAKEVMAKMMAWATAGEKADILSSAGEDRRSVIWLTSKRATKKYDLEALGTTLKKWEMSRP